MRKRTWQRMTALLTAWFCLLACGIGTAEWTPETEVAMAYSALEYLESQGEVHGSLQPRKAPELPGRGRETGSGEQPDYVGVIGYAAATNSESRMTEKLGMSIPWSVASYVGTEQGISHGDAVIHKTPVLVIGQNLDEAEYGHRGLLRVVRLDTGKICFLQVRNFVTDAYWLADPGKAAAEGFCVAEYNAGNGAEPLDEAGNTVADVRKVLLPYRELVKGESPAPETNPVAGIVFRDGTGTLCWFDESSLIIVY